MGDLEEGMKICQRIFENGFAMNFLVMNAMIGMYEQCGRIHKSQEIFNNMHNANIV